MNTKKLFDKDFRKKLIENPKKVIFEEKGIDLKNIDIKITKNTKNTTYIFIPTKEQYIEATSLTEEKLKIIVASGGNYVVDCAAVGTAGVLGGGAIGGLQGAAIGAVIGCFAGLIGHIHHH